MSENGVVKLPSAKEDAEIEMIDVFELDDVTYQMPKKASAGLSLRYLKAQAEKGPDAAIYEMMIEMLGEDAFNVLMEHPSLEDEHLEQIMKIVENHVLGDGSGKSRGGSRRNGSKK